MAKRYARVNFQNRPSVATPLSANILNIVDKGVDDCDNAIEVINNTSLPAKIDKTSIVLTDTVNDVNKVAGTPVTYAHGQSITAINNNLGTKLNKSGDTLTGDLNFNSNAANFLVSGNLGYYIKNNNGTLAFYNHDNTLLAYIDWTGNLHLRGAIKNDIT